MQERFVVPAQASGKNLTRPLMPAAAPAVPYGYAEDKLRYSRFMPDKGHKTGCAMDSTRFRNALHFHSANNAA